MALIRLGDIRLGDIRWFRFESPDKRRPVLVLGRDEVLSSWSQVLVIPLSTQIRGLPWEVLFLPEDGVPSACVLKAEWIRAVERTASDRAIDDRRLACIASVGT
jgi:mRNA interferase MazF